MTTPAAARLASALAWLSLAVGVANLAGAVVAAVHGRWLMVGAMWLAGVVLLALARWYGVLAAEWRRPDGPTAR